MNNERYPQNLTIISDDFTNTDCLSIVNNIKGNSYYNYYDILSTKANEKIANGDLKSGKILWIIANACSMLLEPSSKKEPFKPLAIMYQKNIRSSIVDDFTDNKINFFENILEFCKDYKIKSRLADILWLKKHPKNIKYIEIAIKNYQLFPLQYNDILNDSKIAWERAIKLSLWYRKSLKQISKKLLEVFNIVEFKDGYYLKKIEELLLLSKIDIKYHEEIITKLESFANQFKTVKDFHRARNYFESCRNWTDDIDKLNKFTIEIAELYVLEANSVNTLTSGHFYDNSIKEYRKIEQKYRAKYQINIRIDEIHKNMNKSNLLSLGYMQPIDEIKIDLSDIKEMVNYSNKNFNEALYKFANIYSMTNYRERYNSSMEIIDEPSLIKLFSNTHTHISNDGRVIAKRKNIDFSNKESKDYQDTLLEDMIESYDSEIDLITKFSIIPAFQQLLLEYKITKDNLNSLCSNSLIIPPSRAVFWIEGLYFGFKNNFIVSTHLLIPQIEHLIRVKMKEKGIKTSTINKDGIETENGLSTLLDNEKIKVILGENILFEFKALLTEQMGKNLRNNIAHGLCEVNILESTHSMYFWWLCLRLVLNEDLKY